MALNVRPSLVTSNWSETLPNSFSSARVQGLGLAIGRSGGMPRFCRSAQTVVRTRPVLGATAESVSLPSNLSSSRVQARPQGTAEMPNLRRCARTDAIVLPSRLAASLSRIVPSSLISRRLQGRPWCGWNGGIFSLKRSLRTWLFWRRERPGQPPAGNPAGKLGFAGGPAAGGGGRTDPAPLRFAADGL